MSEPITDKLIQLKHLTMGARMWRDIAEDIENGTYALIYDMKEGWLKERGLLSQYMDYQECPACKIAGYKGNEDSICNPNLCPIQWGDKACFTAFGEFYILEDALNHLAYLVRQYNPEQYREYVEAVKKYSKKIYMLHLEAIERITKELLEEAKDER